MNIVFTTRFRRSYKRLVSKNEEIQKIVNEKILLFEKESRNPSLKDHILQGKLAGYRAFSVGYDLRVIYRKFGKDLIFFDIGTHDKVYH